MDASRNNSRLSGYGDWDQWIPGRLSALRLQVVPCRDRHSMAGQRLFSIYYTTCLCLVVGLTGCAGLTKARKQDQQTVFANPLESRKPRLIIDPNMGMDEYDLAKKKFDDQQYDDAAKDFKEIAKKYYDYPVEEDSMFMLAECRFAARRYPWALDAYEGLIKKYPSSRYLEKSTRRLYAIGSYWLGGSENANNDELLQVSATDVKDPGASPTKVNAPPISILPNVADTSRPVFDTAGHGLRALKAVWLNDPMGPLADDALMLTSAHYIRRGDFQEADHYLDILRKEYPKSEHNQTAFVVGSHVKLANYQGAKYDGRDLVDADDLIRSTLNLYPEIRDREGLSGELDRIRERGAERYWSRVEYYRRRDKPQSEAIYCEMLIKEYPNTSFAERAKTRLGELGSNYYSGIIDPQSLGQNSRPLEAPPPRKKVSEESHRDDGPAFPSKGLPKPESQMRPGLPGENQQEIPDDQLEDTLDRATPNSSPSTREPRQQRKPRSVPDLVDEPEDSEIEHTDYSESVGRARI